MPEYCDTAEDLGAILKYMLANRVESVRVKSHITSSAEAKKLLEHVHRQYGQAAAELCEYSSFADSLSYGRRGRDGQPYEISLNLRYSDGYETAMEQIDAVTAYCRETLDGLYASGELRTDMTQKEKMEVLCRWIVLNYQYDLFITHFDPYQMMVTGSGVCEAYTGLYTMLCRMDGIPIQAEMGTAYNSMAPEGGAHIWNRVDNCEECGGTHFIDTTWCDPIPDRPGTVDWSWFWVDEATFRETHTASFP